MGIYLMCRYEYENMNNLWSIDKNDVKKNWNYVLCTVYYVHVACNTANYSDDVVIDNIYEQRKYMNLDYCKM